MKDKPVNVGIPYNNEQERKWAIAQAERYGYNEFEDNYIDKKDNCIWLDIDGIWFDYELDEDIKTIPLERPTAQLEMGTPATPYLGQKNEDMRTFSIAGKTAVTFNAEDYVLEHKEDGTIILKPKKKKVKVWLVAIKDILGDKIGFEIYYDYDQAHKHFMQNKGALEVIEREYEI